jgi:hypothetical protein
MSDLNNEIVFAHPCLNCVNVKQRFNLKFARVKCLECINHSNFIQKGETNVIN